jgi:hypothetical protein
MAVPGSDSQTKPLDTLEPGACGPKACLSRPPWGGLEAALLQLEGSGPMAMTYQHLLLHTLLLASSVVAQAAHAAEGTALSRGSSRRRVLAGVSGLAASPA